MSEGKLEKACTSLVTKLGGVYRKLDVGPGAKGWCDLAIWLPGGKHLLVELKVGANVMSRFQEHRAEEFSRVGFTVWEIRSLEQFVKLLREIGAMI